MGAALTSAAVLVGSMACTTPCEGAGCASQYSGALVSVHSGVEPLNGELDPLDATAWVEGEASEGPDWSVAVITDELIVGIPEASRVTRVALDGGGALALPAGTPEILDSSGTDRLGAAVLTLPDSDGDGLAELLVGAPGTRRSATSIDDGAAMLFSGQGEGLSGNLAPADATLTIIGEEAAGKLGSVLAACDDVDGDGLADWAAAAPFASGSVDLAGRVVLVRSGDVAGADAVLEADALPTSWFGVDVGARAGSALDCGGDLTGDGHADLVVGAPFADSSVEAGGAVYLVEGGAHMETGGPERLLSDAARATLVGTVAQEWLGWSLSTGDLDGDGVPELVAGAPGWQAELGRIKGWRVNDGVRPGPDGGDIFTATPDFSVIGASIPESFGKTVRLADMDGDGRAEILAGAPRFEPADAAGTAGYDSGRLTLLPGGSDWWELGVVGTDIATATWVRTQAWLRTGQQVATGDANGDGVTDIALVLRVDPG